MVLPHSFLTRLPAQNEMIQACINARDCDGPVVGAGATDREPRPGLLRTAVLFGLFPERTGSWIWRAPGWRWVASNPFNVPTLTGNLTENNHDLVTPALHLAAHPAFRGAHSRG